MNPLQLVRLKALSAKLEDEDDMAYCHGLNMDYWYERAVEYAKETDVAECPHCGDEELLLV